MEGLKLGFLYTLPLPLRSLSSDHVPLPFLYAHTVPPRSIVLRRRRDLKVYICSQELVDLGHDGLNKLYIDLWFPKSTFAPPIIEVRV